jgi:microcystin-dependent protein
VQTGLDADATAADVVSTNADAVQTAADRVQAGLDKTAAEAAKTAAETAQAAAEAATPPFPINQVTGLQAELDAKFSASNPPPPPDSIPSGSVFWFATDAPPTGFIKANGAVISRATYADLFAVIGTTFGAGDGSTTFNLPDLRGEFIRSWDDGRGVDSGRAFGSAQLDQMQRITGSMVPQYGSRSDTFNSSQADGAFSGATSSAHSGAGGVAGFAVRFSFNSANSPDARVSSSTSGETRARNVALLACIKY